MVGLGVPYTTLSSGLQARKGGNMLRSRPSLITRTYAATRELVAPFPEYRANRLGR